MTSEPDQIRSNIEQTQQNLSADVDALTEKVSPPRIVERRVQRTRSAMTDIKDKIMGSATERTSALAGTAGSSAAAAKDTLTDKVSSAADAASSVPQQARQQARGNPLAAGLIALGAGWLLSSLLPATKPEQQMASQVKDIATDKARPVAQQLGQAGQELRESAQQRAHSVKEAAADAASTVTDEARSQASDVTSHAHEAQDTVTRQASPNGS